MIRKLIKKIGNFLSQTENQNYTSVWCECGNELVSDVENGKNASFIRDTYVDKRNVVHYKCSKCKKDNFYDFDHPAPISLPFSDNDEIIKKYKAKFKDDELK